MKTKVLLSVLLFSIRLNAQDIPASVASKLGCVEYQIKYKTNELWSYCECQTGKRKNGNIPDKSNGILITNVVAIKTSVKNASATIIKSVDEPNPVIEGGGILCGSMLLKVKGSYQKYQWYRNGVLISNETSNTIIIKSLGSYYCKVQANWATASNGKVIISNTISINKKGTEIPVFSILSDSLKPIKSSKLFVKEKIDLSKLTFQWYREDSSFLNFKNLTRPQPIKNATKNQYITSRTGVFSLYLSNSSGCVKKSTNNISISITPKKISTPSKISEIEKTGQNNFYYNIYPNPINNNMLHIETNNDAEIYNVLIYNNLSQKVFEGVIANQSIENIDLKNGIYILKIFDKNSNEMHSQFIEIN